MKRNTAIALLAIANVAMAGTSFAQSDGVEANVPFDFSVGNTLLPAGTSTIRAASNHLITIRNQENSIAIQSMVNYDMNRSPNAGKLKFHKHGNQYFLSEILCDEADMNLEVPASKAEKLAAVQDAKPGTHNDTLVAAR
jgi:hypothetical protein